jgi:hypothetical protein
MLRCANSERFLKLWHYKIELISGRKGSLTFRLSFLLTQHGCTAATATATAATDSTAPVCPLLLYAYISSFH